MKRWIGVFLLLEFALIDPFYCYRWSFVFIVRDQFHANFCVLSLLSLREKHFFNVISIVFKKKYALLSTFVSWYFVFHAFFTPSNLHTLSHLTNCHCVIVVTTHTLDSMYFVVIVWCCCCVSSFSLVLSMSPLYYEQNLFHTICLLFTFGVNCLLMYLSGVLLTKKIDSYYFCFLLLLIFFSSLSLH